MAITSVALLSQSENAAVLEITEDGNAAALLQFDIIPLLNSGPLKDFLK
jgi:hypothetical protein